MGQDSMPRGHHRAIGGESSSSSPASSDAATFAAKEQPSHSEPVKDQQNHHEYAEAGPPILPAHHQEYEEEYSHQKNLLWSRIRHTIRDPAAEFLGCFILIMFGDGSVAQVLLSSNPNLPKGAQNKGAYQSISWG